MVDGEWRMLNVGCWMLDRYRMVGGNCVSGRCNLSVNLFLIFNTFTNLIFNFARPQTILVLVRNMWCLQYTHIYLLYTLKRSTINLKFEVAHSNNAHFFDPLVKYVIYEAADIDEDHDLTTNNTRNDNYHFLFWNYH